MKLTQQNKPLFLCEMVHELPGRIRFSCPALKYLKPEKNKVEQALLKIEDVQKASFSHISSNALIRYNDSKLNPEVLLEKCAKVLSEFSLVAFRRERLEQVEDIAKERRLEGESVQSMVQHTALAGGAMTLSLLLKLFFPNSPFLMVRQGLIGKFFNFPALASLALAIPFFRSGFKGLMIEKRPNADTLTATSIVAGLAAGQASSTLTIILLSDFAELLALYGLERTRGAIRDLLKTHEHSAWKVIEDSGQKTTIEVPIEEVAVGDKIVVHTGERIGVDGKIIEGEAFIDQSSITGEFMPVRCAKGRSVYAGMLVKSGQAVIEAEQVGESTAASRVIQLVEDATHNKACSQNYADRFSSALLPVNFVLAGLAYLLTRNPETAVNLLVIDFSCGMRLSAATAFSSAIAASARQGVLIKGGNHLENFAKANTLALDKTGTITEGQPTVQTVITFDKTEADVLKLAAAAEETSSHPIATAILAKAETIPSHGTVKVIAGQGVQTTVARQSVKVGSRFFMSQNALDLSHVREAEKQIAENYETPVYVAYGQKVVGLLGIQDQMRQGIRRSVNCMRRHGIDEVVLLTGDTITPAKAVASQINADRMIAECLPEEKLENILHLQHQGSRVVMVGDGINDALSLAYADVGIAMGLKSSDIASETADISILRDDPLLLSATQQLSVKTMKVVNQNFAAVIGINLAVMLLGASGTIPVFWGATLHNLTTIATSLNSARLFFSDLQDYL